MNPWYFNPIMFEIGPIKAHWYGFMYAFSFLIGYLYLIFSKRGGQLDDKQKDAFVIYIILGVVLGGRIGYMLFYNLAYYFQDPLKIFAVWEGGMSFHGGLLGSALAIILFSRKYGIPFVKLSDIVVSIAPVGLFFAKIGNFINGELYGRVVQVSGELRYIANNPPFMNFFDYYCVYFPTDPANCRYPSQLLEAFLEGIVLFTVIHLVGHRIKKPGVLSALFLVLYGIFRIFVEFFREPDAHIGFLFGVITEGQLLSSLMIVAGLWLYMTLRRGKQSRS